MSNRFLDLFEGDIVQFRQRGEKTLMPGQLVKVNNKLQSPHSGHVMKVVGKWSLGDSIFAVPRNSTNHADNQILFDKIELDEHHE